MTGAYPTAIGHILPLQRDEEPEPAPAAAAESAQAREPQPAVESRDDAGLWIRFLSGPDIDGLGLTSAEIVDAVEDVVLAHGRGRALFEPRVHLVPDNGGAGHFNVLRGHLPGLGDAESAGSRSSATSWRTTRAGLPSELGLLTLYDPDTGIPLAIMDATMITEARTGAMTAVGARYLARPDCPGARPRRGARHRVLERGAARRGSSTSTRSG